MLNPVAQKPHPLDVPEILFWVVGYLDPKDILALSHVSKSLHTDLAPCVWKNVHLGYWSSNRRRDAITMTTSFLSQGWNFIPLSRENEQLQILRTNATWIRSLTISQHTSARQLMFGKHCTMLESLTLHCKVERHIEDSYWNSLQSLLDQSMGCLRSLTLISWHELRKGKDWSNIPIVDPFRTFVRHSNVRSLTLLRSRIEGQDLCHLWSILPQLESLKIKATTLKLPIWKRSDSASDDDESTQRTATTDGALGQDVLFPKLRKLILNRVRGIGSLELLNRLIKPCPLLEILEWNTGDYGFPEKELYSSFISMTWPNLDSITIQDYPLTVMSTEDFVSILGAATRPFKVLDISISRFDRPTFDLLRRDHFETMTTIDLSLAYQYDQDMWSNPKSCSSWVQEVLELCPALEHLRARIITSQDILNGKPWTCLRLKLFEVPIDMGFENKPVERGPKRPKFTEDEERACRKVFGQLSRLKFLTRLEMNTDDLILLTANVFLLPLELRLGLGQLSQLWDIEYINFRGSQDMRMIDIQWMLDHWPHLRRICAERLSKKRSKTFGNMHVRDYLLKEALSMRSVATSEHFMEDRTNDKVVLDKECLHDSDSECESDENRD